MMLEIDAALQDECERIARSIEWKKSGVCAWAECEKKTNSWRYAFCPKHIRKLKEPIRQHVWQIVETAKGGSKNATTPLR